MKPPIIDEVYSALIRQDLKALDRLAEERPAEAVFLRAVIATTHEHAGSLGIDLDAIRKEAPWMAPLFAGPKFFFISPHTAVQARVMGGSSVVPIDWSFSFDSNVAEKVRAYFNRERISDADLARVRALITLKKRYSIQVDLIPFLFENLRLARENPRNRRPLKTIAAFKALDHLDWDAFDKDPSVPVTLCAWEDFEREADSTCASLVTNAEVRAREVKAAFTNAFLLALAEQWIQFPRDPERSFSELIDFCLFRLGKLPIYELGLAWDFLINPHLLRFFGPLAGMAGDLAKALRGMAWDLAHVRALETMATAQTVASGFFLPFFVSFDAKLIELIAHNPTQFILIDERSKRLQSGRTRDWDIQVAINENMSDRARAAMGQRDQDERRRKILDEARLLELVSEKERKVSELASAR